MDGICISVCRNAVDVTSFIRFIPDYVSRAIINLLPTGNRESVRPVPYYRESCCSV